MNLDDKAKKACACNASRPPYLRHPMTGEPITATEALELGQVVETDTAILPAPDFVATVNQIAAMSSEKKPETNYKTLGAGVALGLLLAWFMGGS